MDFDTGADLWEWARSIEEALGIPLSPADNGAFVLCSKGGAMVGVEPVPTKPALILTGMLGTADDSMPARTLRALLALNMAPGLSGTACIGLGRDNTLLLRLTWAPAEPDWQMDAFVAVLSTFVEHVDELSLAVVNREVEKVLDALEFDQPGSGARIDTSNPD